MIPSKNFRFLTILIVLIIHFIPGKSAAASDDYPTTTPIKHLIVLMQENHSFDNYFGTYPGANGYPAGTRIPVDPNDLSAGYVEPWHLKLTDTLEDLSHNRETFREQYNNGQMNGFVAALNRRNQDGRLALGYYNADELPYYWNLADNYVLFDNFFSSAKDGSMANHMFWVAGQMPKVAKGMTLAQTLTNVPTIFDRLEEAGISWKFYVQNYDPSVTYRNQENSGNRGSQVIWVPLLNFDRFIDDPALSSHIVSLDEYFTDLTHGTLPAVSFMAPSGASEQAPSNPLAGQRFVKNIIQELMRSNFWESSAFMFAYDDWGGWYDHVLPPEVDEYGYGLRVPAILVSAYARKGVIDSTQLDFTSYLKFIEENWGIAPLAERDSNANNFLSAFDFTQSPRQAAFLPLTRVEIAVPRSNPGKVIYLSYGLVLFAFILLIVLVVRIHRRQPDHQPGETGK